MSWLTVVGLVVATLVGLWLLRVIVRRVALGLATRLIATHNLCEVCMMQRGGWILRVNDDGPPLRLCRPCVDAKLKHAAARMFERGQLVEDPS